MGSRREVAQRAVVWFRQRELLPLVVLLILAGLTWAFFEIADEVLEREYQSMDEKALLLLRRSDDPARPIGPTWLAEIGRDLTALGGVAVLTLFTAAVCGYLAMLRQGRLVALLLVATLGGITLNTFLKNLIERPRPDLVPHLATVHTPSFPSGHSMLAATVYLTLAVLAARVTRGRVLKAYVILLAIFVTLLVGVSRVFVGVHYPSDVLAGWTAGTWWALLCWLGARTLQRRGTVPTVTDDAAPNA